MTRITSPDSAAEQLRAAGLRVTAPRIAVLNILAIGGHLDADTVGAQVRQQLGSVATQTIYDVLRALTTHGLVRSIQPAGSNALYEIRVGDNHHHLVCRSCAKIIDIPCALGLAPCLQPEDDHGFELNEAEVTYWGYCPGCQE